MIYSIGFGNGVNLCKAGECNESGNQPFDLHCSGKHIFINYSNFRQLWYKMSFTPVAVLQNQTIE